jgi:hypothetical protein
VLDRWDAMRMRGICGFHRADYGRDVMSRCFGETCYLHPSAGCTMRLSARLGPVKYCEDGDSKPHRNQTVNWHHRREESGGNVSVVIWEAHGSNMGRGTDYPDLEVSRSSSVPTCIYRNNYATIACFQILSQ